MLTFDPWSKINRVPPLITNNLHLKFASDRAKTAACIMPTRFHTQSAKVYLILWPRDSKSIRYVPALIIHNLHMKFENDRTAVCIVSTKFYIQSAKVDLDLWPCDTKSIEFLLSLSTVYIWSWKVIWIKLCIYYLTRTMTKSQKGPRRGSVTMTVTFWVMTFT